MPRFACNTTWNHWDLPKIHASSVVHPLRPWWVHFKVGWRTFLLNKLETSTWKSNLSQSWSLMIQSRGSAPLFTCLIYLTWHMFAELFTSKPFCRASPRDKVFASPPASSATRVATRGRRVATWYRRASNLGVSPCYQWVWGGWPMVPQGFSQQLPNDYFFMAILAWVL